MATVLQIDGHGDKTLSVLLFKDVTNAGELQKQIVGGTVQVDCAFINAAVVPDLFLLHLAASAALTAQARGKLTTRSLHAELLYNLSGSKHITESLRRFGVGEGVTSVLAARFDGTPEEMARVQEIVQGQCVPTASLQELTDAQAVRKLHKITPAELQIGSLADAVACRLAARDL